MENALKTYDRFLESYPNELDQNLEALCRAGDIHYQRKDFSQASDYFKRALARYQQAMREGLSAEPYLAAQAQFTLAEIRFEAYKNVKLEPPLDRSLQRKQTLFNEVLGAYKDAATYQIAEWFTAASHRIGSTYEEFGRAFWESPRPALAEDLLAKYEEQLSQKIRPFKERALETYRGNLRQAAENGIDNEWVNQSRQRMQALAAELGQGMESSEPTNGSHQGGQSLDQGAMNGHAPADSQSVHTASAKGNQK
jgi:tetratricopeptide (TPR) repeat protein